MLLKLEEKSPPRQGPSLKVRLSRGWIPETLETSPRSAILPIRKPTQLPNRKGAMSTFKQMAEAEAPKTLCNTS